MVFWRGILIGWAALVLAPWQVPVLRSNADVVVVDVHVTTRSGEVISDLIAADFTLNVDGKPRPISSFSHEQMADAPAARRGSYSAMGTLSMGPVLEAPSYVMIVADPWTMRPESSRILFDQAAEFVAALPAPHAVGLTLLPTRRPQFPFTVERQPIMAALRRQLGAFNPGTPSSSADSLGALDGLTAAVDALRDVEGRRTMVLLTDALQDVNDQLRRLGDRAADANITIHTISTDPPEMLDMSKRKPVDMPTVASAGAAILSDLTGGWFLRRATNGSIVMPRIAKILAEQYVLAFAMETGDKDGWPHRIEVTVKRSGADVRARSSFVR